MLRAERYGMLAALFDYPRQGDYGAMLSRCIESLQGGDYSPAAEELKPLREHVAGLSLEEVQEFYTRTFDINPVCTLEIGWHVYGEDYARGALLVKMRERLREANLPESAELPDHLTHVLALLGHLAGEEADELCSRYLLPGLDKMLTGIDAEHPYRGLLTAVRQVVRTDHDVEVVAPRERKQDPPDWNNRLPMFGSRAGGVTGASGPPQGCPYKEPGREDSRGNGHESR